MVMYAYRRPSDQVVRVNSVDLLTAGGSSLHQYLRSLATPIRMVVKRRKPVTRSTHTAHLHVSPGRGWYTDVYAVCLTVM